MFAFIFVSSTFLALSSFSSLILALFFLIIYASFIRSISSLYKYSDFFPSFPYIFIACFLSISTPSFTPYYVLFLSFIFLSSFFTSPILILFFSSFSLPLFSSLPFFHLVFFFFPSRLWFFPSHNFLTPQFFFFSLSLSLSLSLSSFFPFFISLFAVYI